MQGDLRIGSTSEISYCMRLGAPYHMSAACGAQGNGICTSTDMLQGSAGQEQAGRFQGGGLMHTPTQRGRAVRRHAAGHSRARGASAL